MSEKIYNNYDKNFYIEIIDNIFILENKKEEINIYFNNSTENNKEELKTIFIFSHNKEDFLNILDYKRKEIIKKKKYNNNNISFDMNIGKILNIDSLIFKVENNLYSLIHGNTLDYYYRKSNEDFSFVNIFDNNINYRILNQSDNQEIAFISFNYNEDNKEIYIDYFTVYEQYSAQGYGKYIIELLMNYYKPKILSGESIDADEGYTIKFWKSIEKNICNKNNIDFNIII